MTSGLPFYLTVFHSLTLLSQALLQVSLTYPRPLSSQFVLKEKCLPACGMLHCPLAGWTDTGEEGERD